MSLKLRKPTNKDAKGASIESLAKSREIRQAFKIRYKGVPCSILIHDRTQKAMDLVRDGGEGRSYSEQIKKTGDPDVDKTNIPELRERRARGKGNPKKNYKGPGRAYQNYGRSFNDHVIDTKTNFWLQEQGARKGALSSFSQNIGKLMVDFYCPPGGVVYDPFAGHNSRMQLCYESGLHYIGVDVSEHFMEENGKIRDLLLKKNQSALVKSNGSIRLITKSSASVPEVEDSSADFTITSPPYWNLEYYGDEPEQLGNSSTYPIFLEYLKHHVEENFRILKPGAFCAWFINDFRLNGVFYPFHVDLFVIMQNVGFTPFNTYIVDLGVPITQAFVQTIIQTKIFPKKHEYGLVFFKPK